jgi:uncharacterized protein involved in exopolysaccharide biosynthesis
MDSNSNLEHNNSNTDSVGEVQKEDDAVIPSIIQGDKIDLIALTKVLWNGRKTIYYSIGVILFFGIIIAFASPAKYTSAATLLPANEKEGGSFGNLGALAGMAGINLSAMLGDISGIRAEIYPQVISSYPFQNELMHQKFNFRGRKDPVSLYEFIRTDTVKTAGKIILKYTLRLPWTIKSILFPIKSSKVKTDYGVVHLSKRDFKILERARSIVKVSVDEKTGLVTVSAEDKEPIVTAQIVKKAVDLLQKYVIDYKTSQAREYLEFVQERYDEKKKEYERVQKEFFEYKDRHRNIDPNRADIRYQQLSDEYDIVTSVYKGLAQQLEQSKISVKEHTPVFTVLEPAIVADEKSSPRRGLILFASLIFGGILGIGLVFGKMGWSKLKEKW